MSLNDMLKAYQKKYTSNPIMVLKAIVYFDDINYNEPIRMLDTCSFNRAKIKSQIEKLIKYSVKRMME